MKFDFNRDWLAGILLVTVFQLANASFAQENNQTENKKPKVSPEKLKHFQKKPQIIPAHPNAAGGGNPFQGLGRPDEKHPSRVEDFLESKEKRSPGAKVPPTKGTTNGVTTEGKKEASNEKTGTGSTSSTKSAKNKSEPDSSKEKESRNSIIPPPPQQITTPLTLTPHRKALNLIHKRSFAAAQTLLDDIIIAKPRDFRARYLRAYVFVMTKNNKAAINEYDEIIKGSKDTSLIKLAKEGLKKLNDNQ